jgi:hypothetical protein
LLYVVQSLLHHSILGHIDLFCDIEIHHMLKC